jgi:hypothetical protein
MLEETWIDCPYCGEVFMTLVDGSGGSQDYIEDCPVCCRPIEIATEVDDLGRLIQLSVRREDE